MFSVYVVIVFEKKQSGREAPVDTFELLFRPVSKHEQ